MADETTDRETTDPFDAGMDAFNQNALTKTNPHTPGTYDWHRWNEGWDAASDGAWDAWKSGE